MGLGTRTAEHAEPLRVGVDGGTAGSAFKAAEPLVVFRNVSKTYGDGIPVVRDLDLHIQRGEFLAFLGPSGSGKTTSLMMLAGFEQPTSGEIHLAGKNMESVPPYRREIGVVFQNYALFPHMSVLDNIKYPLRARGCKEPACTDQAMKALAMVRLESVAARRPSHLSGGQQQRVAVARALVFKPNLVLMDEPLGALDKHLREQLQEEIKDIHKRTGVTVVYVTHDQAEALTMSDRIAVFNRGRIVQLATPLELYENPSNSFVASFIGENNLIGARLVSARTGSGTIMLPDGSTRTGRMASSVETGSVMAMIRPERVRISSRVGGKNPAHLAVIMGIVYHGDHLRVKVRCERLGEIVAKLPAGFLDFMPTVGQEVAVSWHDDDCLIVADNAD